MGETSEKKSPNELSLKAAIELLNEIRLSEGEPQESLMRWSVSVFSSKRLIWSRGRHKTLWRPKKYLCKSIFRVRNFRVEQKNFFTRMKEKPRIFFTSYRKRWIFQEVSIFTQVNFCMKEKFHIFSRFYN